MTEGEDGFAELTLVRSGDTSGATVVTVTTADGSATGIQLQKPVFENLNLASSSSSWF